MRNEAKLNEANREWMRDDDNQAEAILAINETGGLAAALDRKDSIIETFRTKIDELSKSGNAVEDDENIPAELKKTLRASAAKTMAGYFATIESLKAEKVNLQNLADAGYIQ